MYKELLETMDKLAASLPPEKLERLAAESLEELNSYLKGNKMDIDDLSREMAFRDLTNDVAVDAADVGRMQGIAAGAAGTLGAVALGNKIMQKRPKGMKKKADIDLAILREDQEVLKLLNILKTNHPELYQEIAKDIENELIYGKDDYRSPAALKGIGLGLAGGLTTGGALGATLGLLQRPPQTGPSAVAGAGLGAIIGAVTGAGLGAQKAFEARGGKDVSYNALLKRLKEYKANKEASTMIMGAVEKIASSQSAVTALSEFVKLAEYVPPEELEVIAEELIEKEAYTPLFRQFAGMQGAVQGALAGRSTFKDAKKGLKMYNQGYGTLPRNQRDSIPRDIQQSYQIDQAIANKGYFGNIGYGAKTGRQQAMNMFDARKQQEAIENYNLHAGYSPPAPPPPGGGKQSGKQNKQSGSQGTRTPPNPPTPPSPPQPGLQPGPQQWAQQAGQWIQNNPYLATAAGVGAGMMIPRAMAGANAAANAQMMVPAAPQPYMYYR